MAVNKGALCNKGAFTMYTDSAVNYYGRQNFGYGDLYPPFHGKKDFADISKVTNW